MAVTPRLELRQSQSLVMTPQLQQAIKLLQLSGTDLEAYVEGELEANPLLERDETGEQPALDEPGRDDPEAVPESVSEALGETLADTLDRTTSETLPESLEQPLDTEFDSEGDTAAALDWTPGTVTQSGSGSGAGQFENDGTALEERVGESVTLRNHLLRQLQIELDGPADRLIGVHLIDLLDEAGYLAGDLSALAERLGCGQARVETTLARLQHFEPVGIFARSLRECLALQLADHDRLDPAMAALLDHLHLLAGRNHAELKLVCGVDDEDLTEMIAEIRALNPKPALDFDTAPLEPVSPDILMRPGPDGGWLLELNSDTLPRVLADGSYYSRVLGQCRSKAEKSYVAEQFQSANWLVKALHQRATTILKVATEIVRRQDAFFRKGVQHLRPMTLRDVAEIIEMHESTVSRATANKYMATPRGIYDLKYFFSTSIAGTGNGSTHSAEAVRDRIRRMIEAEEPAAVLSDDTIVEMLNGDGIDIARRTVAKYRDAMRIPSSVQRRRDKSSRL